MVTAGPTREFFDPVRFLSNPSSGKMGYALAEEAVRRGHRVVLISGPVALPPPSSAIRLVRVVSAQEMCRSTLKEAARADLVMMAAAVSDFRPAAYRLKKLKKTGKDLTVRLMPNPDILKTLGQKKRVGQILVGFAAETDHVRQNALKKLQKKNLDFIVANRVGVTTGGFATDQNRAILLAAAGLEKQLPSMSKKGMSKALFEFIMKKR